MPRPVLSSSRRLPRDTIFPYTTLFRSQSRNGRKLFDESRNTDQRRRRGMIVVARSNHRNRANVIPSICVPMNAFVQLWRSEERRVGKEGRDVGGRDG